MGKQQATSFKLQHEASLGHLQPRARAPAICFAGTAFQMMRSYLVLQLAACSSGCYGWKWLGGWPVHLRKARAKLLGSAYPKRLATCCTVMFACR